MAESYQTFRWAVLGTGAVSRRFVLGLRACERPAEVAVVAGRDAEAARRFARSLGIARHAESYEAAAGDDGVDAVYVATPPSLHEAHAMAAINAGRPVLIEKPMAMDAAGAARIAELAQRRGIFCMEAMWTRFLPALRRATEMAAEGVLGELRGFHGGFFGALTPDPAVSQFDPARGGGALMHRGVYAVSLARRFLGPVVKVDAVARIGATGVDEDCALMLTHATGAVSSIEASLVTNAPSEAVLRGTEGTLRLAPIYRPDAVIHARTVAGKPGGARRFEAM
ncbi:MAG: Gfo/Idh/MocA family oxidoreductase, partial [Pseudomonadota bacterium]